LKSIYYAAAKISAILSDKTCHQPDVQHDEAWHSRSERKWVYRCRNELSHLCIHKYVFTSSLMSFSLCAELENVENCTW